jgi:hypothetical protein
MTQSTSSETLLPISSTPPCQESGRSPSTNGSSGPSSLTTAASPHPSDWALWLTADYREQPAKFAPSVPIVARVLLRSVISESGCWLYQGSLDSGGYSCLRIKKTNDRGHRITWEAINGPVPVDRHLDHLCRVRHCVNPTHLEPVEVSENVFGRAFWSTGFPRATHCQMGHKMTDENTYRRPGNQGRQCRICIKRRTDKQSAKRKASLQP